MKSFLLKYAFTISVVGVTIVSQILTRLTGFIPDSAHISYISYLNTAPFQSSEVLITINTILLQFVGIINYILSPSISSPGPGADLGILYILIIIFFFFLTILELVISFGFILLIQKMLNFLYPNFAIKTIFFGFLSLLFFNLIAEFIFIDSLSIRLLTQCFEFSCVSYLML
jgi:hypothetical protein